MQELQDAFDTLLIANPEFTFWESCAELIKKGDLNPEATGDQNAHTYLFQMFQRSKVKARIGRLNTDI